MLKLGRILFVAILTLSLAFAVSCEKQGSQFNHESITFDSLGGEVMVIVTGPGSQAVDLNSSFYMEMCESVPSETNAYIPKMVSNSWLSVSDNGYNNDQRLFKITATPNDSQETRKSIVLFIKGNLTYRVTVKQGK